MNWPNPYSYKRTNSKYSDAGNGWTSLGSEYDLIDGGVLKYIEDNSNFGKIDDYLTSVMYLDSNTKIPLYISDSANKRIGRIKGKPITYNLRSSYYNFTGPLVVINESGNLGEKSEAAEIRYGSTGLEQTYIFRFRPALILPFNTKIKSDEITTSNSYKYYADRISALEWIQRAKKLRDEVIPVMDGNGEYTSSSSGNTSNNTPHPL